jgi:hypothetical protein
MEPRIACLASGRREAKALSARVAALAPRARVEAFSMAGYLAAEAPPLRLVLCPPGLSVEGDLDFLARAARRLLWPAPPPRLRQAIGGLRGAAGPMPSSGRGGRAARNSGGLSAALLLEGKVDLARARAALAAPGPRAWIVETPASVRISRRHLEGLARAGVRWSALEPVSLVGIYATPALARAKVRWKGFLPPTTRVWVRR